MKTTISALATLLGSTLLGGCLTVGDDDGAILAVELFWDGRPGDPKFISGDCESADVDLIEWELYDTERKESVADDTEPCANRIDVVDPAPGVYELRIKGFDQTDVQRWAVTCTGLQVLRFDVLYECDVDGLMAAGDE